MGLHRHVRAQDGGPEEVQPHEAAAHPAPLGTHARADEPERTVARGHLLNFTAAHLATQHSTAPKRHSSNGCGGNCIEHAHESQVLGMLLALGEQALHSLHGAPTG